MNPITRLYLLILLMIPLKASPHLDRHALQRAQGSFARMAEHVECIPSLAGTESEAAATYLHTLQESLDTLIASRDALTPDQRTLVNEYIAFYARLTPELLASMNDVTAAEAQHTLQKLHHKLQPYLPLAPSAHYALPALLIEALRTLEVQTTLLLEPSYYASASWWQRVKHVARNPGSLATESGHKVATAVFLSAMIIGTTLMLTRTTQQHSSRSSPDVEVLVEKNITFNNGLRTVNYTEQLTTVQGVLTQLLHVYDDSGAEGQLSKRQRKWVERARTLVETPANEQKPPPTEKALTEALEHLAEQRNLTIKSDLAALLFRLTGIDTLHFMDPQSEAYAAAEQAGQKALFTHLTEEISALRNAYHQVARKLNTASATQLEKLATFQRELSTLETLTSERSITTIRKGIRTAKKVIREVLAFYAETGLEAHVGKQRASSLTTIETLSTTVTDASDHAEAPEPPADLHDTLATTARTVDELVQMLIQQIQSHITALRNPLLATEDAASTRTREADELALQLATLQREIPDCARFVEALLTLSRRAADQAATLSAPHDDDKSTGKRVVRHEFRWRLPTRT